MTATVTQMPHTDQMADDTLGALIWDAWTAARNAHPSRLRAARARLSALSAEARRRGYLVTTDHISVRQAVTDGHQVTGTVVAITEHGGVIVEWPVPRVPNLPATKRTHFLATALLTGALSAA